MDLWLLDYILGSIISIVSSISFFHCELYIPIFFRKHWLFVKQEQHEAMLTEKLMLAAQAAGGGAAKSAPWLASGISNSLQIQFQFRRQFLFI